ncbi:MAG: hypothetical protein PHS45_01215 [Bacilli bacterium]|nr:hypothetical protein [Bacilli bacterium]
MKDNSKERMENEDNMKGLYAYDNLCDATDSNLEIAEEMTDEVPLRTENSYDEDEENLDDLAVDEDY